MISVSRALDNLFAITPVLDTETVPLLDAAGRVLAETQTARITQPPFDASAMDGYAARTEDCKPGEVLDVVGMAQAGAAFAGAIGPGEAVRIFTGAPIPTGADRVVLQEDILLTGDRITLSETLDDGPHIRKAGNDFSQGALVSAPTHLTPANIALLAAMNIDTFPVFRKPKVAILPTGDELVQPGEAPRPDQIIASNSYGIAARLRDLGAEPRLLPIARDSSESLRFAFGLARGADLVLTIGGASVGDFDLVAPVAKETGLEMEFYKVAMRPGKPLMAGRFGSDFGHAPMIGLPGNPVSAMVCTEVFVAPVLRAMQGLGQHPQPRKSAPLAHPLGPNGQREHYMRGALLHDGQIKVFDRQDSALLTVLSKANALIVRNPGEGALETGAVVDYLPL